MNDATNRDPGASATTGGDRDHGNSPQGETAGSGDTSSGGRTNGGDRRRPKSAAEQRVRWIGIASAVATVVFLLAQMYGTVTGNKELSENIQEKIPTTEQIQELGDAVGKVQDSVEEIPPPVETTIIQKGEPGAPGQPGQPGQPGEVKIVRTAPNTVVVTTSAPIPPPKKTKPPTASKPNTSTPTPKPTCATTLFGACIIP